MGIVSVVAVLRLERHGWIDDMGMIERGWCCAYFVVVIVSKEGSVIVVVDIAIDRYHVHGGHGGILV